MSRSPIDQLAKSPEPTDRQAIWDVMLDYPDGFTMSQLRHDTWVNKRTLRSFVDALRAGGYLSRTPIQRGFQYTLLKRPTEVPRLRPNGEPVAQGNGVENMWRTMRMLREFTPRDVAVHSTTSKAQVAERTALAYVKFLHQTGYLLCIQKSAGKKGQAAYRLIRNTGPKAPMIQKVKRVYDPNLCEVFDPEPMQ